MFIFYISRSPDLPPRIISIMAMAGQITAAGLGFSISYYCSHQIAGSSARVQLVIVLYIIIDTDPWPSHTAGCFCHRRSFASASAPEPKLFTRSSPPCPPLFASSSCSVLTKCTFLNANTSQYLLLI